MTFGITPSLLISQVQNTAPFIWNNSDLDYLPYIKILKDFQNTECTVFEYFKLCLSAHYTSVACFVPTDVDNQIRHKLWLNTNEKESMADFVIQSLLWDFKPLSARGVSYDKEWMSGHHGEWFSVATGAYAANPKKNDFIRNAIAEEIKRQEQVFINLREVRDGIGMLKASTIIAHNLGDLDRVMDQWELSSEDSFRKEFFKLGHLDKRPSLQLAGHLNKAFMVNENHRHFILREPKILRKNRDFLLPIGPFFDEWGATLAKHPEIDLYELLEVVHALLEGIDRLERGKTPCIGYTRAIAGIASGFPGGLRSLSDELSAKTKKRLLNGPLYQAIQIPKLEFEKKFAKQALDFKPL